MKKICLLLWLTLPVLARGQSAEVANEPTFFAAKGAFFGLSVADVEASAKWYSESLGLKVVMNAPKRDKSTVIVLAGGGLIVELLQNDDAMPVGKEAQLVHGIFKSGLIVDDLDKTLTMIKARKIPIAFGPFPAKKNGMRNFIVIDNAGNLIQFFGK